jgi:hypothetical protein
LLRKIGNIVKTRVSTGFACILEKFEYDCFGGRNLRVWFESYLRSHSFSYVYWIFAPVGIESSGNVSKESADAGLLARISTACRCAPSPMWLYRLDMRIMLVALQPRIEATTWKVTPPSSIRVQAACLRS